MSVLTTLLLATLCGGSLVPTPTQEKTPLASKHFTWPNLPNQVSATDAGPRGPQLGFNICNSTTQSQTSNCQTSFVNDITDFCMWAPSSPNSTIEDTEGVEVAWCTKPGHGTRVIPAGALQGVQFLYAKDYLQVVGFVDLPSVNIKAGNDGGELDPHGADGAGNPIGGIEFSNGFGQNAAGFKAALSANTPSSTKYTQVIEWVDFIGSSQDNTAPAQGRFCIKVCNPANPTAPQLCAHIYDEIGCDYNAPAAYGDILGKYLVCDSEDMTPPGVYTTNGVTSTWVQPFSGPVVPPYTPTIPASSNCQTFASTDLFAATAVPASSTPGSTPGSTPPSSSGTVKPSSGGTSGTSSSRSGSTPAPTQSKGSSASVIRMSSFSVGIFASVLAALLFV